MTDSEILKLMSERIDKLEGVVRALYRALQLPKKRREAFMFYLEQERTENEIGLRDVL